MKNMKTLLMAVAITAGIGGAVAANSQTTPTLYFKASDGNFYPAGVENYDFVCEWGHFSTCTYTYKHLPAITRSISQARSCG
jgi:hypothetical protein